MSQAQATIPKNPRVGMLAIVRKRRAVISEVRPFDGQEGVLHLVRLDYKDDSRPETEELIWELEPARRLLEPNELPRASDPPCRPKTSTPWSVLPGGRPSRRILIRTLTAPLSGCPSALRSTALCKSKTTS